MSEDVMERLARANPQPGDLPALALETIGWRLHEPPAHPGDDAPVASRRRWGRIAASVVPLATAAVVVIVVGAIALTGHRSANRPQAPAALVARLPVFGTPSVAPPRGVAGFAPASATAHRVVTPVGTVWVAATRSQLCVTLLPTGASKLLGVRCETLAHAERYGVVQDDLLDPTVGDRGGWVIFGVVPAAVRQVVIGRAYRPSVTATIFGGAFAARGHVRYTIVRLIRTGHGAS